MKKVLITGFNGFVGQHACRAFADNGFEVIGISNIPVTDESTRRLASEVYTCDLSDAAEVAKLTLGGIDTVLNLAGFATNSGGDPEQINRINIGAHVNLYRRILELGLAPRIIAISSGAVYDADQPSPLTELSRLKDPEHARPYEASKILMEEALSEFEGSLEIIKARPMNHFGPGQRGRFIFPDFADMIKQALQNGTPVMTGSLVSGRDYTDVRDVVNAYFLLATAEKLNYDTYNICSGISKTGQDILDALLTKMDAKGKVEVREDPTKLRGSADMSQITGSYSRINDDSGWEPQIPFEQTVSDYVEWVMQQP